MSKYYAYHTISDTFVGNIIYPLSELRRVHPEIASKAAEKYIGREKIIETIVYDPNIQANLDWGKDVLKWSDVSFFTLHNPKLVFETFTKLGKQPLLYVYVPHLLTPDPVSFDENDIFEINLG